MSFSIFPEDVRAAVRDRGSVYPGDAEPASLYYKAEANRVLASIRAEERWAKRFQPRFRGKLRLVLRLGQ